MTGSTLILWTVRRTVPSGRRAEYDSAWKEVVALAEQSGGHAWRFRSEKMADAFIEFVEMRGEGQSAGKNDVMSALAELEEVGLGMMEAWRDATEIT